MMDFFFYYTGISLVAVYINSATGQVWNNLTSAWENLHKFYAGGSLVLTLDYSLNATFMGAINSSAAQTTVAGSVGWSAVFMQSLQGSSDKRVKINCSALNGTASYTFPTAFTATPVVVNTTGLSSSLVTSLSTSAVTVTGAVSTGILIIEGI